MRRPLLPLPPGLSPPCASARPVTLGFYFTPAVPVNGAFSWEAALPGQESSQEPAAVATQRATVGPFQPPAKALPLSDAVLCSSVMLSSRLGFSCAQAPHCLPLLPPIQMLYQAGLWLVFTCLQLQFPGDTFQLSLL